MSKPLLDDAILSLEDAAMFLESHAQLAGFGNRGAEERAFRRKADEIRSTIARLQRNAQQETSESGEREHGR